MPPSRKMSLPFDQRIKPERKMALKAALMNYAREENKKQLGKHKPLELREITTVNQSAAQKGHISQKCVLTGHK